MPKRLTINSKAEVEAKDWVRTLLRTEMTRQKITYRDLADRLTASGLEENERNIANKVARGEMSAATFLLCLKVIGCDQLRLEDHPFAHTMASVADSLTIDQALQSELIKVIDRFDSAGIYRVRVGNLTTPITIFLMRLRGAVRVGLSHEIVPSLKRKKDFPTWTPKATRSAAIGLNRAIRHLVEAYETGVRAGKTPSDFWLVPVNMMREVNTREVQDDHRAPLGIYGAGTTKR